MSIRLFFPVRHSAFERGAMVSDINLANSERQLLQHSDTVIMICDSTKFGEVAFARITSTEEIDVIVTDNGISPQQQEALEGMERLQLIVVP